MNINELKNNLDDWIDLQYLDELAENTLKLYRNAINKFIKYLEDNQIDEFNKNNIIEYKKYLDSVTKSDNSKNIWIIVLNKYFKYLNHSDFCLKQIRIQSNFNIYNNITKADYKRLLRISKRENRYQDYYIIKTLAMTGVRISELQFFTVENLKRQNDNVLYLFNKKKERYIPVRNDLARELRKYCRDNRIRSGSIFPSPTVEGQMIGRATIHKHLKQIASLARVNKKSVHAHSFRHYFADIFLETYPENVLILADLLGHRDLKTTRIYTKKTLKQQKLMLSKMDFTSE